MDYGHIASISGLTIGPNQNIPPLISLITVSIIIHHVSWRWVNGQDLTAGEHNSAKRVVPYTGKEKNG